ncbi:hypothetical protein HanRHA438_Chr09g0383641 [Helianthus annuus]|nr:hypothetical protein HanRHA438_Chr09g0383641 [Helianthus annuus]
MFSGVEASTSLCGQSLGELVTTLCCRDLVFCSPTIPSVGTRIRNRAKETNITWE